MAKKIAVMGCGYVGLLASVGLADFGNTCVGIDINPQKITQLQAGKSPIYEPGLDEYLRRNLDSGRLSFTSDADPALRDAQVIFLTVGTPPLPNGQADLTSIIAAADAIAQELAANPNNHKVIVIKSTVPVGTNRMIRDRIALASGTANFDIVSNPEFLREGRAVQDFFHPDRTVIGYETPRARDIMFDVYRSLNLISVPFVWCSIETAELIKYAANAFLAVKISYINEIANLADAVGADVHTIAQAMGMDGRISPKFLHPGPGYGGSCFPKDTQALVHTGRSHGVNLSIVEAAINSNNQQKMRMVQYLAELLWPLEGKTVAVLGLAFKQETDDSRESPAITMINELLQQDAIVRAYDPKAMERFAKRFPGIEYCYDAYTAAQYADALVIMTEWNEFRSLDLERLGNIMVEKVILDTRNVLDPATAEAWGFRYRSIGRPTLSNRSQILGVPSHGIPDLSFPS